MDACLACGVDCIDASYECEDTEDPKWRAIYNGTQSLDLRHILIIHAWAYQEKFEAGLTTILGNGFVV